MHPRSAESNVLPEIFVKPLERFLPEWRQSRAAITPGGISRVTKLGESFYER
jgi:hypothetical protein